MKPNYVSALHIRSNPDILHDGACFLKGNQYYSQNVVSKNEQQFKQTLEENANLKPERNIKKYWSNSDEASDSDKQNEDYEENKNGKKRKKIEDEEEQDRIELQEFLSFKPRYFKENVTTRCLKCGIMGHIAVQCTNEAIKDPCYLCGEHEHESNSCPNKLCFICNEMGHQAKDCRLYSQAKSSAFKQGQCQNCFNYGHTKGQCLLVKPNYRHPLYIGQKNINSLKSSQKRCVICSQFGHLFCGNEKRLLNMNIELNKKSEPIPGKDQLNAMLIEDDMDLCSEKESSEEEYDMETNLLFGKRRNLESLESALKKRKNEEVELRKEKSKYLQCLKCGGEHHFNSCEYEYNKGRSFDNCRRNFILARMTTNAERTKFKENWYPHTQDYHQNLHNSSYSSSSPERNKRNQRKEQKRFFSKSDERDKHSKYDKSDQYSKYPKNENLRIKKEREKDKQRRDKYKKPQKWGKFSH